MRQPRCRPPVSGLLHLPAAMSPDTDVPTPIGRGCAHPMGFSGSFSDLQLPAFIGSRVESRAIAVDVMGALPVGPQAELFRIWDAEVVKHLMLGQGICCPAQ